LTANQIAYANYIEKRRNDLEVEKLRKAELEESKRATDLSRDTNLKSIEAGVLNVQRQAEASKYSANQSAGASIYSANTQKEINQMNIEAQADLRQSQTQLNQANADLTGAKKFEAYTSSASTLVNAFVTGVKFVSSIFK